MKLSLNDISGNIWGVIQNYCTNKESSSIGIINKYLNGVIKRKQLIPEIIVATQTGEVHRAISYSSKFSSTPINFGNSCYSWRIVNKGKWIASSDNSDFMEIYDLNTFEKIFKVWCPLSLRIRPYTENNCNLLIAGSKTINVWDLKTFKLRCTFNDHFGITRGITILKNGFIATADTDGSIRIWDIDKCHTIQLIQKSNPILNLIQLKDGRLGVEYFNGGICLIDPMSNNESYIELKSECNIMSDSLVEADSKIFSPIHDHSVAVIELRTNSIETNLRKHKSTILSCLFTPYLENGLILTGSRDKKMVLWDLKKLTPKKTFHFNSYVTYVGTIYDR